MRRKNFTANFAWFVLGALAVVASLSGRSLLDPPRPPGTPERAERAELVILTGKDDSADESTKGQRHKLIEK